MARRFALLLLLSLVGVVAFGGDIAKFVNLGFSDDADVFVFGQYGIESEGANAFAAIYAVDVPDNRFVSNGVFTLERDDPLTLGQDGRGALYTLLGEAQDVVRLHEVDHLRTGRPIYILIDGDEPKPHLAFRDFAADTRYDVTIAQDSRGSGDELSSSFYIDLTLTYSDDSSASLRIGRPDYYRDGVDSYRITQILVGPDQTSVVFVVEKRSIDGSARYMVETARAAR